MKNILPIIRRVSSSLPCAGQWKCRQALWVGALKSTRKLTNWSKSYWLINQLSVNQLLTRPVVCLTPRMISAQPMWKSISATKLCSSIRIIRKSWKPLWLQVNQQLKQFLGQGPSLRSFLVPDSRVTTSSTE